jgi:malate dehydrogenase (oxaloacetate-decarboxylating)(NADP+)
MNGLILPGRQIFLVDTHVNADPTAQEIAEITVMAAEEMRRFGLQPKAALLSHSNFGSSNLPSAQKMRDALPLIREAAPWLEVDGEMHGDAALDAAYRTELMPRTMLSGEANLLVFPNLDSANITLTTAPGDTGVVPLATETATIAPSDTTERAPA